jgi:hypothetical protein
MTIPALLSHFGINTPRFITTEGRVIFDGVSQARSGGLTHPEYGSVSAMTPHTFHGGSDEPSDAESVRGWWLDSERLTRHDKAVALAFPGFIRVSTDGKAPPSWGGVIDTGRGKFVIGVFTRWDEGLPSIYILRGPKMGIARSGRWIPSPHLYLSGALCVADQSDWRPEEHTVATAIGWAAHWLAAYTEWRITHRWPVEGMHLDAA